MVTFFEKKLDVNFVVATNYPDNGASRRVAEKYELVLDRQILRVRCELELWNSCLPNCTVFYDGRSQGGLNCRNDVACFSLGLWLSA